MTKVFIQTVVLALTVFFVSCDRQQDSAVKQDNNGWQNEHRITKTVGNIIFTFPPSGWAFDHRDSLVNEFPDAITHDISLINMPEYTDTIRVVFVNTRREMIRYTSMPFAGLTFPDIQTCFFLADTSYKPLNLPFKHEIMHMITCSNWGMPYEPEMTWMKEGIAAYAAGDIICGGNKYTIEQLYAYILDNKNEIPMDSLLLRFYGRPEMVTYYQSAYIVQYLLDNYGVDRFSKLWQGRFTDFEKTYGMSYRQIETEMNEKLKQKHPALPQMDWSFFVKGCR